MDDETFLKKYKEAKERQKEKQEKLKLLVESQEAKSKEYSEKFNSRLKQRIKNRDFNKCQMCGAVKDLVSHHVDYNKKNCQENNLVTLCRGCNSRVNKNRQKNTEDFKNKIHYQLSCQSVEEGQD